MWLAHDCVKNEKNKMHMGGLVYFSTSFMGFLNAASILSLGKPMATILFPSPISMHVQIQLKWRFLSL